MSGIQLVASCINNAKPNLLRDLLDRLDYSSFIPHLPLLGGKGGQIRREMSVRAKPLLQDFAVPNPRVNRTHYSSVASADASPRSSSAQCPGIRFGYWQEVGEAHLLHVKRQLGGKGQGGLDLSSAVERARSHECTRIYRPALN